MDWIEKIYHLQKLESEEAKNGYQGEYFIDICYEIPKWEKRELEEKKIDESILEEISSRNRNKSLTLSNFLKLDLEAGDEEEEQETISENYDSLYCKNIFDKNDKDSDEIMTGYMQKKSYLTLLLISF